MGTSVIPVLIDALVDNLPAVVPSGVIVLDSYDTSNDSPNDFLMVGVADPLSETPGQAAFSQQVPATIGSSRSRDEMGQVACAAVGTDGGGRMRSARASAYAIAAAVETWTRTADRAVAALGLPGLLLLEYGADTQYLQNVTSEDGAVATVVFRIAFKARI